MAESTRYSTPLHLAPSQPSDCRLSHLWAAPLAPAWCSNGKAHNRQQFCWWYLGGNRPQAMSALKERRKRGKRGWPPKDGFIWEDPEFETQIHSAMNSRKISFTIQPVPYSKPTLPLSHFGAVTVMGLSDIFQWNNLPRETVVSSQWKLHINSNLLISLPHLLPQICEEKGKDNMLIF